MARFTACIHLFHLIFSINQRATIFIKIPFRLITEYRHLAITQPHITLSSDLTCGLVISCTIGIELLPTATNIYFAGKYRSTQINQLSSVSLNINVTFCSERIFGEKKISSRSGTMTRYMVWLCGNKRSKTGNKTCR